MRPMSLVRARRSSGQSSRSSVPTERVATDEEPKHTETRVEPESDRASGVSIVANASSLVISRLVVAAMGWSGTVLIVRHLSVADWGKFSFVFGFLGLMSVVTNMANPRVVFRELAKDDGRIAGTYVLLRLALGLLAYVFAMSFVTVGNYPSSVVRATAIAGSTLLIANASSGYDVIFQYRMRLSKVAVAAVLGQAAQLVLTIVLAVMHSSMVIFTIPAVLCEVVTIAWKRYKLPRRPALRYRFMWGEWVVLMKVSIPLALGGALSVMYYSLDSVMLSKMKTFHAVGIYGISYKFAGIVAVFGSAMTTALFPTFVKYWPDHIQRFRTVFLRSVRLSLLLGVLLTFEFTVFAAKVISLLYGHKYAVSAPASRLVVGSECLGFFVGLSVTALISMNRNVFYPIAALIGLLINLGINLWVIPRWSYNGAAWATLVTEIVVLASLWIPIRRSLGGHLIEWGVISKTILCTAAAVAACLGAWTVMPWPAAAVIGACVYVAALVLSGVGGRGGWRTLMMLDDQA